MPKSVQIDPLETAKSKNNQTQPKSTVQEAPEPEIVALPVADEPKNPPSPVVIKMPKVTIAEDKRVYLNGNFVELKKGRVLSPEYIVKYFDELQRQNVKMDVEVVGE